jgi:hypothetical protein
VLKDVSSIIQSVRGLYRLSVPVIYFGYRVWFHSDLACKDFHFLYFFYHRVFFTHKKFLQIPIADMTLNCITQNILDLKKISFSNGFKRLQVESKESNDSAQIFDS